MLVLISVKTGLYLGTWANVVIGLRVERALHVIFLVVPIVSACPAVWGIGNLNQTAAVEAQNWSRAHPRCAVCFEAPKAAVADLMRL